MAASDILYLNTSIGARTIRVLYGIALILIALAVIIGVVRGVEAMTRAPRMPRPAVSTAATPGTPPQNIAGNMNAARPGMARATGPFTRRRDFADRRLRRQRGMMTMMRRQPPMMIGIFIIIASLVRGAIALMVVRILAEMGLSVLSLRK